MKKLTFIITILILIIVKAYPQSVDALQEKNGFQDLRLGDNISKYENFKQIVVYGNENENIWGIGYDLMYVGPKYKNIGEVKILNVFVKLYENRIAEIGIRCEYNPILLISTKVNFGEPNGWINNNNEFENGKATFGFLTWKSKDVRLNFYYKRYYNKLDSKSSLVPDFMSLNYHSRIIEREIDSKKNRDNLKKIEQAADDY